ncbi:MAG TPA: hypothetical protein VGM03_14745 [Phycisphaerae bacterium]|jgi:hypothetical protein
MFTPKDIISELRAQPFEPFQIKLSDGSILNVRHPDQAMVVRGHVIVGLPPEASENGGSFESATKVSILHITELRPLGRRPRTRRP